uniref:Uncharacterized protein n=1 Tax=Avena sativa TaxID=4498 RepID=A0ACD5V281_AVESA
MAEFWYNTSHHSALGCSAFTAVNRTEPNFGAMQNLTVQNQIRTDFLRAKLLQAQQRMKSKADKNRTERQFSVGDKVLLKLQLYAQQSMVNRPFPKLSYKYFGPYEVVARIGEVAYKLRLPALARVHPVFHVSQLKPFTANYSHVFSDLPATHDLAASATTPELILDRRLVRDGNAPAVQVMIKWMDLPIEAATWEDYHQLKARFPSATLWEGDHAREGGNVTHPP